MHLNFHHAIYQKMIILSRNYPFVVVLRLNENGDPVFICVSHLLWLHKKYIYIARSFTCAIFRAVSVSSFGLNRTETLATQATR